MFRKSDGGGKGDIPRPIKDREKFESNWDSIFKKKDNNETSTTSPTTEDSTDNPKG